MMVSMMRLEYPEFGGDNFRIARNAAPRMYGHANEHKIGVFVKFRESAKGISTEEARAAGQALINLADAIEHDQANRLHKLRHVPNGTVFTFENGAHIYIKLTDSAIWSDYGKEVHQIQDDEHERKVRVVKMDPVS